MTEILETLVGADGGSNPVERSDQQLDWVVASQNGDAAAFNRLVLKWQRRVFNLSLRMLRDPEEAADATQETFFSAYKAIRRFRLEAHFSTWLYRIASNQCLTRLRRRPVVEEQSLDETGLEHRWEQSLASPGTPEGATLRMERQERVRRSLSGLPPDQRIVVELKFFQEQTFEEIASALEVPLSTVKSRFYAGLQGLKQRLSSFASPGERFGDT